METNKALERTITKGIVKAQLIGIAISLGFTLLLGLLFATFGKETPKKVEENKAQ